MVGLGLKPDKGFYSYDQEDPGNIDQKMRTFSFAIRQLMGNISTQLLNSRKIHLGNCDHLNTMS